MGSVQATVVRDRGANGGNLTPCETAAENDGLVGLDLA